MIFKFLLAQIILEVYRDSWIFLYDWTIQLRFDKSAVRNIPPKFSFVKLRKAKFAHSFNILGDF